MCEKSVQTQGRGEVLGYNEEDVISFPGGLPGFEECKKFVIISVPEYEPFHWLQSIEGKQVRLAIINPLLFKPDYNPKISREDLHQLEVKEPTDLLLYVIVTVRQPVSESTANLMGPLLINLRKKMGCQLIIEDNAYSLRARIL